MLSGDGWISFDCLCGRRRIWSAEAGRARDRLRFVVWIGDLGFVKAGVCVGLCISVAVWTAWRLVQVFTSDDKAAYLRKSRRRI